MNCEDVDRDPLVDPDQALEELMQGTGMPADELIKRAIRSLHRTWIGNDPCQMGTPFIKEYSPKDADIVLRQIDPTTFVVAEGFRLRGELFRAGNRTDLASVPSRLTWLVARYGRHSLPAIVHDQRVDADTPPALREEYDVEFRDNMNAMKVPFIQRWFMWAAVSLATLFKRSLAIKLVTGLWAAGFAVLALLIPLFILLDIVEADLRKRTVIAVLMGVFSPLVFSTMWLKRYNFGLISSYSILVISVPTVAAGLAWLVYRTVETASKLPLRWLSQPAHPISARAAMRRTDGHT